MSYRSLLAGSVSPVLVAALLTAGADCSHSAPTTPAIVGAQGAVPLAETVDKPIPAGGTPMVPAGATIAFSGTPEQGKGETVPVTGQPFATAQRFQVSVKPANTWAIQATVDSPGVLKKGDVLFASFYVRAVQGQRETGEVRTQFIFEQQGSPWTKYSEVEVSAGQGLEAHSDSAGNAYRSPAPNTRRLSPRLRGANAGNRRFSFRKLR